MTESLRDIYNGFAETYDQNRGLFDMSEVFHSFYNKLGEERGTLLDLGCGASEPIAKLFIERGWKATGVDFSEKMLELAQQYVPELHTIQADMRSVKFPNEKYDAITAIYSLFHLSLQEQKALFGKFYQWLRLKGKALFTYATREYTGADEFEGFKNFMGQELFYAHTTPEKLYFLLEKTGFKIIGNDYYEIGGETFLWITIEK